MTRNDGAVGDARKRAEESLPSAESDAPVSEADVWPVHRALGDWMWKDPDAPRLSRDAQWRIAEWIVRRHPSPLPPTAGRNPGDPA